MEVKELNKKCFIADNAANSKEIVLTVYKHIPLMNSFAICIKKISVL